MIEHLLFVTEGLKLELLTSLLPSVNEKGAKINATYKQPNIHTVATLDVLKTHFTVNSVAGRQGFLAGGEVSYNVLDGKVNRIMEEKKTRLLIVLITIDQPLQCCYWLLCW